VFTSQNNVLKFYISIHNNIILMCKIDDNNIKFNFLDTLFYSNYTGLKLKLFSVFHKSQKILCSRVPFERKWEQNLCTVPQLLHT